MRRTISAVLILSIAATATLAPTMRARGDEKADKAACLGAADKAQELRGATKLRAARDQLLVCARDVCPAVVRKDCAAWLAEVDGSMASIVLSATRGGSDVFAVKVTIDGETLVETLDGKAIMVDPGPHKLVFTTDGSPSVEQDVLVKEGEKNRAVNVSFAATSTGVVTPPPPPPHEDTVTPSKGGGIPVATYVFGGVAILGLADFAYFGLKGRSQASDLRGSCAPNCAQSDVDSVKTKLHIADIGLGVGIVSIGLATYFALSSSSSAPATTSDTKTTFDVRALPGGGAFASFGGALP